MDSFFWWILCTRTFRRHLTIPHEASASATQVSYRRPEDRTHAHTFAAWTALLLGLVLFSPSTILNVLWNKAQVVLPSWHSAPCFPAGLKCCPLNHFIWLVTEALSSLHLCFNWLRAHWPPLRGQTYWGPGPELQANDWLDTKLHASLMSYKYVGTMIFRFLRTAMRKGWVTVSKTVVKFKLLLKIVVFSQNE